MWNPFKSKKTGTIPDQQYPVVYSPILSYRMTEQDKWTYPWPHQTRPDWAAMINCWSGNQLPGATNFIPGVVQSYAPWMHHRNLMNNPPVTDLIHNKQLNPGLNIAGMGQIDSNLAIQSAGTDWHTKLVQIWQGGDMLARRS